MRHILRFLGSIVGAVLLAATLSAPSYASSFNDSYYGPTNRYAGSLTFNDGSSPNVILGDFRDGYHTRLRIYAFVDGSYHKYYDKYANDGLTNRFGVSNLPRQKNLKFTTCFYTLSWSYVGACSSRYAQRG